ncbi:hypothetical protein SAMN07250955_107131 [Arboricoccus pini]|uniref:Uncharacterized protein n=1 Tax=Arboricoccus pini TaxID=1963835 RepID=A0A212RD38_9PROT|nr:hypothetical protein [Arboricoccus pini]SNB70166.1 hypothetical protein SAMN07250955_107131 [Arboricoccus pini]
MLNFILGFVVTLGVLAAFLVGLGVCANLAKGGNEREGLRADLGGDRAHRPH